MSQAGPVQVIDVKPWGKQLAGQTTASIAKTRHLEILRLVLHAGEDKPAYIAPGEVIIHCLEGRARLSVFGQQHELAPGQLIFLPAEASHSLHGIDDCSLLMTVLLDDQQRGARPLSQTGQQRGSTGPHKGEDEQAGSTGAHG